MTNVRLFWDERRYREESDALKALERMLPPGTLVLGIDLASPAEATAALISAKRAGTLTAVYPVATDPMEDLVAQISRVIGEHPVHEQRYVQMHALRDDRLMVNDKPPSQNVSVPQVVRNAATLVLKTADVVLTASSMELRRWSDLIGKPLRRFAYVPLPNAQNAGALPDGLTVYAPGTPRAMLRFVELALQDRRLDAAWITAENANARPATRTVIAPEWWRPMQASALACQGHVVVSPAHGADERVFTIPYRPLDIGGLAAGVEAALTASNPYVRSAGSIEAVRDALEAAKPPALDGPLVSVIVRTFNRPALLARSLASIKRQTYRNVEAVVVNNGGDDVGETVARVCADFPHQYISHPGRDHISVAANVGVRSARGAYIAYLDDDDLLYPDHLARAVAALERTGADLAFSDSVAEYAEIDGDAKTLLGFQIFLDREFDRDEVFAQNFAPIHSIVHRKTIFERFGYFDESLPVTDDWEMWLRASQGSRFVHVDRATVEYSWRFDPARGNMTLTHQQHFVDAYRRITERYADRVADRVLLPQLQERALAQQQYRVTMLQQHPEQLREIMLGPQLANAVPVGPLRDPAEW